MDIRSTIEKVKRQHFANEPALLSEISEFESRAGWRLDDDLKAFYLACNGANLYTEGDSAYRFLPLKDIVRARVEIYGKDDDKWGPASYWIVCSNGDGNYVGIDVSQTLSGKYPMFDIFHETFCEPGYQKQIADSFGSFLEKAINSNGRMFWLK